jgi:hypothetical protein
MTSAWGTSPRGSESGRVELARDRHPLILTNRLQGLACGDTIEDDLDLLSTDAIKGRPTHFRRGGVPRLSGHEGSFYRHNTDLFATFRAIIRTQARPATEALLLYPPICNPLTILVRSGGWVGTAVVLSASPKVGTWGDLLLTF